MRMLIKPAGGGTVIQHYFCMLVYIHLFNVAFWVILNVHFLCFYVSLVMFPVGMIGVCAATYQVDRLERAATRVMFK